ncbi:hypothetical protein O1611_g6964 [Lasiodiplodia mahajangana]|uniref:Uncharacterized protein n=1 Tax=Lasiodiplodia mahajangana TaxID=1108764 RepID=A0ACC2JH31_9PEZI|nr:hypothetical protein O1611_g6964 [Lasiodiplodia mahajangana]
MEAIGTTSSIAAQAKPLLQSLSHIHMALERQKHNSIHLTMVLSDVEATESIVNRIVKDPRFDNDDVASYIKKLFDIATRLENLVVDQETKAGNDKGFCLFAQDFIYGPREQGELEALKSELVASRVTPALAKLALNALSTTTKNAEMEGLGFMSNSGVINK